MLESLFQKTTTVTPGIWKELFESLEISTDDHLLEQSVTWDLFGEIIKGFLTAKSPSQEPVADALEVTFTKDEMNALRYVAGYVPHKLLRKHEVKDDQRSDEFTTCLGNMAVVGESCDLFEYTKEWLEKVNRGGLFPVNDETFTFFVSVEKVVRRVLTALVTNVSQDVNLKQEVVQKASQDADVQFYWTLLSQDISSEEDAVMLLNEILNLWVTIRGYSLAASWVENYKSTNKRTTQKSVGLRKSLNTM